MGKEERTRGEMVKTDKKLANISAASKQKINDYEKYTKFKSHNQ